MNFNQSISISNLASWILLCNLTCGIWSGPLYIVFSYNRQRGWVEVLCSTMYVPTYLFGGIVLWEHSTSTIHTNMLHVANLRSSLHSLVISYQRFLEGIRNSHQGNFVTDATMNRLFFIWKYIFCIGNEGKKFHNIGKFESFLYVWFIHKFIKYS